MSDNVHRRLNQYPLGPKDRRLLSLEGWSIHVFDRLQGRTGVHRLTPRRYNNLSSLLPSVSPTIHLSHLLPPTLLLPVRLDLSKHFLATDQMNKSSFVGWTFLEFPTKQWDLCAPSVTLDETSTYVKSGSKQMAQT